MIEIEDGQNNHSIDLERTCFLALHWLMFTYFFQQLLVEWLQYKPPSTSEPNTSWQKSPRKIETRKQFAESHRRFLVRSNMDRVCGCGEGVRTTHLFCGCVPAACMGLYCCTVQRSPVSIAFILHHVVCRVYWCCARRRNGLPATKFGNQIQHNERCLRCYDWLRTFKGPS